MRPDLFMIDLFSGMGGASAAMVKHGWRVTKLDTNADFVPDVALDIRETSRADVVQHNQEVHLLWASPPCTEFSRESMPWCRTGKAPSLELVEATLVLIEEIRPRFWLLENVRGAVRWLRPLLGEPVAKSAPIYLWGRAPSGLKLPKLTPYKERLWGKQPERRSKTPYQVSLAVAQAVERAIPPREA